MTILVIDHNGVQSLDREIYREVSTMMPEATLLLAVPLEWREAHTAGVFERENSVLRVFPMKVLFGGKSHRVIYRGLTRFLRDLQPDIIYANAEPESFLAYQVLTARHRTGGRPAVILDSWRNITYGKNGFPYKAAFLHQFIERRSFLEADRCVVHTEMSQSILRQSGYALTTVIPPAVDTRLFTIAEGKADSPPHFHIGFVGRLIPGKGVDLLMHAFAGLPDYYRLVIVGGGPCRSKLERLSQVLSIGSRVSWLGPVPHSRIPHILQDLDVCVLPSRTTMGWKEQFGRILIEAMACGVPVVGSSSGEIPSVIGDAGMIFREGDSADLASCLTRLFSDHSARSAYIDIGRHRVCRLFDTRVVAVLYAELFRAVAADDRQGTRRSRFTRVETQLRNS